MELDEIKIDMLRATKAKPLKRHELRTYNNRLSELSELTFNEALRFLTDHQFLTILNDDKIYLIDEGKFYLGNLEPTMPLASAPIEATKKIQTVSTKRFTQSKLTRHWHMYKGDWLLTIVLALLGIAYGAGTWRADVINYELRQENKNLKESLRVRPPLIITQDITVKDTSDKSRQTNDTHSLKSGKSKDTPKNTFNNSSSGQQNNNAGSGKQTVINK